MNRVLTMLLSFAAMIITASAPAEPMADRVYGQPDFQAHTPDNHAMPPNARIRKARGVAVNSSGVFIGDEYGNRVLFFPYGRTEASRVFGQADFETTLQNFRGISVRSLALPRHIDANDVGLVVGDQRNCRVVLFPLTDTLQPLALGPPNGDSTTPDFTGDALRDLKYPTGATVDKHGGVYVADSMSLRVVYFPPGQRTASRVYYGAGVGTRAQFNNTEGLTVTDDGVYICDPNHNRVVFFPGDSMVATRVYGQPGFDTVTANTGGIGPASLRFPMDVAVDSEGVYIADTGNNRVLYYPGDSTTATVVYGQPDFTTDFKGYGQNRFVEPIGVAADDSAVYVADAASARVLRFPKYNALVANRLVFSTQPSSGMAMRPLSTQPVVSVLQANGQPALDYTGPVTLRIAPTGGSPDARIRGEVTVNAVNGVASFQGLSVDSPGVYRMEADSGTLTGAVSAEIVFEPSPVPSVGDFNDDGKVDLVDTALALRVLTGLEAFPNGQS